VTDLRPYRCVAGTAPLATDLFVRADCATPPGVLY
jgi:hypothetical protein